MICVIFSLLNSEEIKSDFNILTQGRKSQVLTQNMKVGNYPFLLKEEAKIEYSFINCTNGPVYIGVDAEIMEGCFIKGF